MKRIFTLTLCLSATSYIGWTLNSDGKTPAQDESINQGTLAEARTALPRRQQPGADWVAQSSDPAPETPLTATPDTSAGISETQLPAESAQAAESTPLPIPISRALINHDEAGKATSLNLDVAKTLLDEEFQLLLDEFSRSNTELSARNRYQQHEALSSISSLSTANLEALECNDSLCVAWITQSATNQELIAEAVKDRLTSNAVLYNWQGKGSGMNPDLYVLFSAKESIKGFKFKKCQPESGSTCEDPGK
ncbi:hypothetical protein [Simiduia agarivorans]|uniref:Uncharacterized protein n=1 Tax=Simiduia agarivorans (strain DSM 21679 / JCM 13881 / BCRC 17597 / SA1) TaxID=1117647 RepID=K4KL03_SIMAS|nr:hypothetical protein [Simiduia agarivorans]AFU98723.1 hypothetical protein M5M_07660 [Simiduia agarivorans SA1 = DSM 21679]